MMLRRDFLKRMAFAAVASGVLGRFALPEPVEWVDDGYAFTAEPRPMTWYVTWTEIDGHKAERVLVSKHGERVDFPSPDMPIVRGPGVYAADGIKTIEEMRALARS